jgi:hypothetical protein
MSVHDARALIGWRMSSGIVVITVYVYGRGENHEPTSFLLKSMYPEEDRS